MSQNQFLLHDHQTPIRLQAERVALYRQGEIIEAYNEKNEVYYLFFYKCKFLTAAKPNRLRRKSYIEHAFKKGMVFQAPHPFISQILSTNDSFHILSLQQLVKKLTATYTPQEKVFILTFFESFFPKKHLFTEMTSTFYEYRRNGQMFLGYQIVRILMDFAPKNSLVKQLASDVNFSKYTTLYNQNSKEIIAKDHIFVEKTLYAQIENEQCFLQLAAHLKKEFRWLDLIALYLTKLANTPSTAYYQPLINLLEHHFNKQEIELILEQLSCQLPTFLPLQQDLFNYYVQTHNVEAVLKMMKTHHFKLTSTQARTLGDILEQIDVDAEVIHPELLTTLLKAVLKHFPQKAEQLLTKYVIALLKTQELSYIKDWLNSFKEDHKNLQIIRKIDTMQRLNDNLEDMYSLGELYYQLKQHEKAVECFSWEMELNPTDPKPLQWLAKLYREMGMEHQSEGYRQLCINIQKRA
ncbi:hypothetical protein H1D32_02640 [Anaerobacillus sp. CMMVII]|uniref:tetratricopeptide repeat protein n=1 Tax=Anaerobacillus sp. CMMVII TaxID=2755588 RepID=UPI0021B71664|nr:tetratricopeptide repeat protein [Anaerobacillus sp. CMMVII]MCT8136746.1 hypothetical protein [Anaerobacillus sp. CMMVII]